MTNEHLFLINWNERTVIQNYFNVKKSDIICLKNDFRVQIEKRDVKIFYFSWFYFHQKILCSYIVGKCYGYDLAMVLCA
jgi:hypothetical protein